MGKENGGIEMANLKGEIASLAKDMGIDKIGFTTKERLKDAPLSADLGYVLPSAKSAISLCVALDKSVIRPYLSKREQWAHDSDHKASYFKLKLVGQTLQKLLEDKGYKSICTLPNFDWREGQPFMATVPDISHKCVAVASGIGWYGWNQLVLTPEYGATVSLVTVVTSAELEPDEPLEQEDWCEKCRLCVASCPTHYLSMIDEDVTTIAGRNYIHSKRRTKTRCVACCGSAVGVNDSNDKWSSWSPGVLELPGPDADDRTFEQGVLEYAKDPKNIRLKWLINELGWGRGDHSWDRFDWSVLNELAFSCGHCMLICWPDMKDRQENLRLLRTSGRVMKNEALLHVLTR
jgi:epoxyqueuosine reductase